jgi:hypothetical protein
MVNRLRWIFSQLDREQEVLITLQVMLLRDNGDYQCFLSAIPNRTNYQFAFHEIGIRPWMHLECAGKVPTSRDGDGVLDSLEHARDYNHRSVLSSI